MNTLDFTQLQEDQRIELVSSGIDFMRTITETWGPEKGMEMWDVIADTVGTDYKGAVFFAMLTGDFAGGITVTQINPTAPVPSIKAIRTISQYGLKEAKDIFDRIRDTGRPEKVELHGDYKKHRSDAIRVLREAGCNGR